MDTDTILLILFGALSFGLGCAGTFSQSFATNYALKSSKAFIWRKILGEQKAIAAMRWVFGPIAMVFGTGMIALSIFLLLKK